MAGIHGKNAQLRVSTSETVISGVSMPGTNGSYFQVASTSQRDWRWDRDKVLIQFTTAAIQGSPSDVNGANGVRIGTQTRLINYAGGAIHLGQYPAVFSGVFAMAPAMDLSTIANLVGDARKFTVRVTSDTVDSTVIGDPWKSFEDGLAGFEGSLDGLHIDNFWYRQAVATLSGLIPRIVLRMQLDPKNLTSYYQGTVIFPSWEVTGGFDQVIERTMPFQGRGPLDLIQAGVPFFKVHETT